MGTWRMRPPQVSQLDFNLCWAASIASYTHATPGVKNQSTESVLSTMLKEGSVYGGNVINTLRFNENTRKKLFEHYGLTNDHSTRMSEKKYMKVDEEDPNFLTPRDFLQIDYLAEKLKKSHVVFSFSVNPHHMWHTILVYGVDRMYMCAMDPYGNQDYGYGTPIHGSAHYRKYLMKFFTQDIHDYILMWRD